MRVLGAEVVFEGLLEAVDADEAFFELLTLKLHIVPVEEKVAAGGGGEQAVVVVGAYQEAVGDLAFFNSILVLLGVDTGEGLGAAVFVAVIEAGEQGYVEVELEIPVVVPGGVVEGEAEVIAELFGADEAA